MNTELNPTTLFSTPVCLITPEIVSAKLSAKYYGSEKKLKLTINTNTIKHQELVGISRCFRNHTTKESFVRYYYLCNFLIHEAGLKDVLKTYDLETTLGISKETRLKFQNALVNNGDMDVHMEAHCESARQHGEALKYGLCLPIETFKYEMHPGMVSPPPINRKSKPVVKKLIYVLTDSLYNILYEMGYAFKPTARLASILPLLSSRSSSTSLKHSKLHPSKIYYPRYNELEFPDMMIQDILAKGGSRNDIRNLVSWFRHKNEEAIYSSGRIYHAFHRIPRTFRHYLSFNGSRIVEAMDVHASFYCIIYLLMRSNKMVDRDELSRFGSLVRSGGVYEDVMSYLNQHDRAQVKEEFQRYRNASKRSAEHMQVDRYFKEQFPTIREALAGYDTYWSDTKHKKVKWLQKDASRVETELISKVCFRLDANSFTLHDALYISEAELADLKAQGIDVEKMFWEEFDALSDERVKELIAAVREDDLVEEESDIESDLSSETASDLRSEIWS